MKMPTLLKISLLLAGGTAIAYCQSVEDGRKQYESRCAGCHGGDGNGGELGPAIIRRVAGHTDAEIGTIVRNGLPNSGMPAFRIGDEELKNLISYVRTLLPEDESLPSSTSISLQGGKTLRGLAMNQSATDLQLRSTDNKLHLLRRVGSGTAYREVTSQTDWASYNGNVNANRYSTLKQINKSNVDKLAPKWIFPVPGTNRLQVTPVVVEGVMYVTLANQCWALDAGSGRRIWHYARPRTKGLIGNAAGGINRGVSIAGDRVFMVTDHAHIIALNRHTGSLLWDTEMADWHQNYNATSAPLAVGKLVITGTAGGDEGVRGFIAAFDQKTGKEAWRFWTVPKRGEPGSETWKGDGIDHPGAVAWFTGSYDPELDTVYWQTGNPGNDLDGDDRGGDNLYSCSIVALDAKTGKLKWYYQYTPHDVWDWDAEQPPVLVDMDWEGQPRKLLLHANRNGFFYVLDRTTGKLLRATPFVKKLDWAKGIGSDGRPILVPNKIPTEKGTAACPALEGATNWYSTSFNPETGYYYLQTLEKCQVYRKLTTDWQAGKGWMGGSTRPVPGDVPQKILRAIDVKTGKIAWELPQTGPATSWGGVLSTAGGVVMFCDDSGAFAAADAATGKPIWQFQTNELWKASPMTYMFDNIQYVAVASGPNIIAFGLPD